MSTTAEIRGFPTVKLPIPPFGIINDKTEDSWKLLEDVPVVGEPVLELAKFLHYGETYVKGNVMFERAVELGNRAGQQHAERLLARQEIIPEEWREFCLVFPGTKWHDSEGVLVVPDLHWRSDRWYLYWHWLDTGWSSDDRLVRCKELQ